MSVTASALTRHQSSGTSWSVPLAAVPPTGSVIVVVMSAMAPRVMGVSGCGATWALATEASANTLSEVWIGTNPNGTDSTLAITADTSTTLSVSALHYTGLTGAVYGASSQTAATGTITTGAVTPGAAGDVALHVVVKEGTTSPLKRVGSRPATGWNPTDPYGTSSVHVFEWLVAPDTGATDLTYSTDTGSTYSFATSSLGLTAAPTTDARLASDYTEVLQTGQPDARLVSDYAEVLQTGSPDARLATTYVEALVRVTPPTVVAVPSAVAEALAVVPLVNSNPTIMVTPSDELAEYLYQNVGLGVRVTDELAEYMYENIGVTPSVTDELAEQMYENVIRAFAEYKESRVRFMLGRVR